MFRSQLRQIPLGKILPKREGSSRTIRNVHYGYCTFSFEQERVKREEGIGRAREIGGKRERQGEIKPFISTTIADISLSKSFGYRGKKSSLLLSNFVPRRTDTPTLGKKTLWVSSHQYRNRARFIHSTAKAMSLIVKEVPTMGDSITEGTLIEWVKNVGEKVEVDDVVCIVETDKVSVDIRSEDSGVLSEVFAEIDDTVEVGKNLYSLDTEGTATATSSSSSSVEEKSVPPPKLTPVAPQQPTRSIASTSTTGAGPSGYVPSIQFRYGQRPSVQDQLINSSRNVSKIPPSTTNLPVKHTPGAKDFVEMPIMFGRPVLSTEEMEAIESGGAF